MAEILERVRERLEEVRTKAKARIEEIRARVIGGAGGKEMKGGILEEVREKGVIGAIEARFPKVREVREKGVVRYVEERVPRIKEIRERGILTRGGGATEFVSKVTPTTRPTTPARPSKREIVYGD